MRCAKLRVKRPAKSEPYAPVLPSAKRGAKLERMTLNEWLGQQEIGATRRLAIAVRAFEGDVGAWARGKRPVPPHRCVAIERATAGEVTAEELRPDLAWVRVHEDGWPDGKPVLDVEAARAA